MPNTPAAELARIKVKYPLWTITATAYMVIADLGKRRRITAPTLAELENYLASNTHITTIRRKANQ